jgi:cation diffusion facilitator CzcD-associated flavoprotein CzcO
MSSELPVAVIGAGPQGLAAATHLLGRGIEPLVVESGDGPAAAVSAWGHVRMFSPWSELVDSAAARLLEPTGWTASAHGYPTGQEWIDGYLAPLAAALDGRVRYGTRVTGVSRRGRDRLVSADRDEQPFVIHMVDRDGVESRFEASAVIDASGTWERPNPVGADGLPAIGERDAAAAGLLSYTPPTRQQAAGFAGKHVIIVGSGHSAMTAVLELAGAAREHPARG